jgi:hypothetical protein
MEESQEDKQSDLKISKIQIETSLENHLKLLQAPSTEVVEHRCKKLQGLFQVTKEINCIQEVLVQIMQISFT